MKRLSFLAFLAALLLPVTASADLWNSPAPVGSQTRVTPTGGASAPIGRLLSAQFTPGNNNGCFVGDSIVAAGIQQNSVRIGASGGTAPYTFSVTNAPAGLSTTTSSPNLYFTASTAALGSYSITVTATDNVGATGTQPYTLTIATTGITLATNGAGTGTIAVSGPNQIAIINQVRGPAFWAQALSNRRIVAQQTNSFGHPGDTTAAVLARMSPILAANCGFYVLMIGSNDLGVVALSTFQANLLSIVNQLLQTGRPVFWMPMLPRTFAPATFTGSISSGVLTASSVTGTIRLGGTILGLTTALPPNTTVTSLGTGTGGAGTYNLSYSGSVASQSMTGSSLSGDTLNYVNRWIRSFRGTVPNLYIVDGYQSFIDPSSTSGAPCTGAIATYDCTYDGVHPRGMGAYYAFAPLATALTSLFPDPGPAIISNTDLYSALNTTGNLLANPMLSGTSGTVSGRASGTAPTGWTVNTADGGCSPCTFTATASASTLTDGTPAERIVIAGTAGGGYATYALLSQTLSNFQNISTGDKLQASCRVEVAANSAYVTTPYIELSYTSGGIAYRLAAGPSAATNPFVDASPTVAYNIALDTPLPAPALPGGLTGTMQLSIGMYLTNSGSQTVAGDFKIGACSLRKVS